jgi:hypothetical protein
MQNNAMATTPEKPKTGTPKASTASARDYFFDPVPVPEATESSTDTAWGLWEHTLQSFEKEMQKEAQPTDFQDTMALDASLHLKKP